MAGRSEQNLLWDANVFRYFFCSDDYRFERASKEAFLLWFDQVLGKYSLYIPSIVEFELKKPKSASTSKKIGESLTRLEKAGNFILKTPTDILSHLLVVNDIFGDHDDKIKLTDKIILAEGRSHFGSKFYLLTADRNDFLEKTCARSKNNIRVVESTYLVNMQRGGNDAYDFFGTMNVFLLEISI